MCLVYRIVGKGFLALARPLTLQRVNVKSVQFLRVLKLKFVAKRST